MSISDPETKTGAHAASRLVLPRTQTAVVGMPERRGRHARTVPDDLPDGGPTGARATTRAVTDRWLAFMELSCDFFCACLALPLALIILSRASSASVNSPGRFLANMKLDAIFPLAVVLALAVGAAYRTTNRRLQRSAFLELRELSFGVGCGCVLTLAIGALTHGVFGTQEPYATQLLMAVIVAVGLITLGRVVFRLLWRERTTARVLVVGSGPAAERIMLGVRQDPAMSLVGRAVAGEDLDGGALGRIGDLPRLCQQLGVDRIMVAANADFSDDTLDVYQRLHHSVHIAMVPRFYELISWRSRLTDHFGTPFLEVAQPHMSAWDRFMKRAFDLSFSTMVLVVLSPLLAAVAVGVKLSSPGPVFFRQVRLGRTAQPFTLTKFRTMAADDGSVPPQEPVAADDPGLPLHQLHHKENQASRITRIGAFLRRTGIDELPQFFDVFKGDMSIVGPRPFVPDESEMEGSASQRFMVRPGITGLWQVSGRNDLTRNDLVQLDSLYVASWSLWWDIKIIFETPITMVRGTGAY